MSCSAIVKPTVNENNLERHSKELNRDSSVGTEETIISHQNDKITIKVQKDVDNLHSHKSISNRSPETEKLWEI